MLIFYRYKNHKSSYILHTVPLSGRMHPNLQNIANKAINTMWRQCIRRILIRIPSIAPFQPNNTVATAAADQPADWSISESTSVTLAHTDKAHTTDSYVCMTRL